MKKSKAIQAHKIHASQTIDIGLVSPNTYNYNRQVDAVFRATKDSLKHNGFTYPVIVRRTDKAYEIIDGEHRYRAAKELGYTEIPVIILPVDEKQAKALSIIFNETKGDPDEALLAKLLVEVSNLPDMTFPYTDEELKCLLETADSDVDALLKDEAGGSGEPKSYKRGEGDDTISLIEYLQPADHEALTAMRDRLAEQNLVDKRGFAKTITVMVSIVSGLTNKRLLQALENGTKVDATLV